MLLGVCPVVNRVHAEKGDGGGEDIEVQVTVITRCIIISSRSYSGYWSCHTLTGGLITGT